MLIKGTCQKQNLMQVIHDAILSPGSNWTEISSNKTNDFKWSGAMSDGWVFKSPPIGPKQQNIFLTLKSLDLSVKSVSVDNGGNHLYIWLADDYKPSDTSGKNGTYTNKSPYNLWCFSHIDNVFCSPTSNYDYFIDIVDHRIIIIIQRATETTYSYPQFMYIGYPDLNTNIEGENYTNQLILGSNMCLGNSNYDWAYGHSYWHRCSNGNYFSRANVVCNINSTNPTPMGLYLLTPIYINGDGISGIQNTGTLGILSDIYCLPATNIINGDIVNIGSDSYKVFNLGQWIINSAPNYGMACGLYYYNSITPTCIAIKVN